MPSVEDIRARVSALLRQVDSEMKNGNLDHALELTRQVFQYDTKNLYARALEERILVMKTAPPPPAVQKDPPMKTAEPLQPAVKIPPVEIIREEKKTGILEKPKELFEKLQTALSSKETSLAIPDDSKQMEEVERRVMQKMNSILESKQRQLEDEYQRKIQELDSSGVRPAPGNFSQVNSLQQLQINNIPVLLNYREQQDKEIQDRLLIERQHLQEEMFRRLEEAHKNHEVELANHLKSQYERDLESEVNRGHQIALKAYGNILSVILQYKVPKTIQQALMTTMRTSFSITEEEHTEIERYAQIEAYTKELRELLSAGASGTPDANALSTLQNLYSITELENRKITRQVKRELGLHDNTAIILIIDDEPSILSATSLLLEESYKTILTADSIDKAVKLIQQQIPDLILCDVALPGTGGFAFFENIQQGMYGDVIKSVPFVFASGVGDQYFIKGAKQLGAKAYLVKPFTREALERTVKEALG